MSLKWPDHYSFLLLVSILKRVLIACTNCVSVDLYMLKMVKRVFSCVILGLRISYVVHINILYYKFSATVFHLCTKKKNKNYSTKRR